MKKVAWLLLGIALLSIIGTFIWWWQGRNVSQEESISSFSECADAGYPVTKSIPAQCSIPNGKIFVEETAVQPGPITVTGEMVCLPHKDTSGPQTLECAFGLLDAKGVYYALSDSDPMSSKLSSAGSGETVEVVGIFTPQPDTIYQSIGVIEVESVTPVENVTDSNTE